MSEATISDLQLDRYLAGEMVGAERAELASRLETDTPLQARLDELKAARDAFSLEAPAFARVVHHASSHRTPKRPTWLTSLTRLKSSVAWLGGGTAAAAAAVVVVVVATQPNAGDIHRTKGNRFLEVALLRDGVVMSPAATSSTSTTVLYPDDLVRFTVDAGIGARVAVLSRDAAGTISVYAPVDGALERAEGRHAFANSTRLDDVVGDERFVGVRCQTAVSMRLLQDHVRRDLDAPEGCEFDVMDVRKVPIPVPGP